MAALRALSVAQICEIAVASRAAHDESKHYWEEAERSLGIVRDPNRLAAMDVAEMHRIAAAGGDRIGPERSRLHRLLRALSLDARRELEALMWLGRDAGGDFGSNLKHARTFRDDLAGDLGYIAAKPLWEYLPSGVERLFDPTISTPLWKRRERGIQEESQGAGR